AAAPIAAPFPPPAIPPTMAPRAAPPPPPMMVRLPRPLEASTNSEVSIECFSPLTRSESRDRASWAPPFKRPAGAAVTTVPTALAPAGITLRPLIVTGAASEASKRSPSLLSLVLIAWSRVTVSVVPAGTTIGAGAGAGGGAGAAGLEFELELLLLSGEVLGVPGAVLDVADEPEGVAEWLQPPKIRSRLPTRQRKTTRFSMRPP